MLILTALRPQMPCEAQDNGQGVRAELLPVLAGRVDHRQDACAERFGQLQPGVDQAGQVGVNLRFKGQGMGQGVFGACRNIFWRIGFRRNGQGVRVPLGVLGSFA